MSARREFQKHSLFVVGPLMFLIGVFFCAQLSWAHEFSWGNAEIRSNTQYKLQWSDSPNGDLLSDDPNDQDLIEILGVDMSHSNTGVTFSFLGKYQKDLDGTAFGSIFQDYVDVSSDERQRFDAFYAYLEKKDVLEGIDVRIGRQYAYSAETVHFDGIYISGTAIGKDWLDFEVFGGAIVQLYSDLNKDGVGGINLAFRPSRDLTLNLESVVYQKTSTEGRILWRPMEDLKVRARWALIDEHNRDWNIDLVGTCPRTNTTIGINVYKRFKVKREDDFIYDYTFSVSENLAQDIKRLYLAREIGYIDYTISLSQPIPRQEGLTAFVRLTARRLSHESQEDLYNTNFYRWTLGVSMEDWWLFKGTKFTLGYSKWYEDRDELYEAESTSVYGDLSQEITEKITLGAGFYYKTEDVNSLIEGEAAQQYYGLCRYKLAPEKWAELKYEYERDDYYREFGVSGINALTATINFSW